MGKLMSGAARQQLVAKGEGAEDANTFCISLRKVKWGGGKVFPSENIINNFLRDSLKLYVKTIYSDSPFKRKKVYMYFFIVEKRCH